MGIFSNIGAGIGGAAVYAGLAGDGGQGTREDIAKIFEQLQTSNFDYRSLSPPQLQILGQYEPQIYEAIVPPEARQVQDSAQGRGGQLAAVQGLTDAATGGTPLVDRLATERASRAVQDTSRAANEDVLRSLAARGDLGSGDELQARIGANQGAQNLAADLGSRVAEDAALRRLAATGQLGQAAGQLRAGDVNVSSQNAGIANRFNELFVRNQQQQARDAAAARERTQAANLGRRQEVGDFNATAKYNADLGNVVRQNELRGASFDQNLRKAYGQQGALGAVAAGQDREQKAKAEGLVNMGRGAGAGGDAVLAYYTGGLSEMQNQSKAEAGGGQTGLGGWYGGGGFFA